MNTRITNIIKVFALTAALALAHGGLEHVMGTVTQVSDGSVTVKTTAGKTVAVTVDAKTTYTRASKPIQKSDLKVGDRVVIHAEEEGKTLTAKTVEAGASAPAKAAPAKSSASQK
jgi:hypothetical protein